jgi:hypothetical protein
LKSGRGTSKWTRVQSSRSPFISSSELLKEKTYGSQVPIAADLPLAWEVDELILLDFGAEPDPLLFPIAIVGTWGRPAVR